jgi:hypothetical protein
MKLDLLGDLLSEMLKFLDSGFDLNLTLHDETIFSDLSAKEMFRESGGRWFLRAESVPGDPSVKAIGVDKDGLYLEMAPLDRDRAKEVLIEEMLPFVFDAKQSAFLDVHQHISLVNISQSVRPEPNLGLRCLCTVSLKEAIGSRRQAVIKLMDVLWDKGCFVPEETEEETISAPVSQRIAQRLQLGLQQRLMVEQRPLLALRTELRDAVQLGLRADVRMLLTLEKRLISMTPEEMADFVVQYVAEHGEERMKNI